YDSDRLALVWLLKRQYDQNACIARLLMVRHMTQEGVLQLQGKVRDRIFFGDRIQSSGREPENSQGGCRSSTYPHCCRPNRQCQLPPCPEIQSATYPSHSRHPEHCPPETIEAGEGPQWLPRGYCGSSSYACMK